MSGKTIDGLMALVDNYRSKLLSGGYDNVFAERGSAYSAIRTYAEALAAPAALPADARSDKDYAIENAEYMATAAERFIQAVQARDAAYAALEEIESDRPVEEDEREDYQRAIADQCELANALRGYIYEFRKRRDRAIAALPAGDVAAPPGELGTYKDVTGESNG